VSSVRALQRFVHSTLSTYSLGAYRAVVSGLAAASQILVDPDWISQPVRARTVESPILDITPKVGTPMAVVSQDAAPSFPLAVGQLKEEGASEAMTAWVRANLEADPNDIQVGGDGVTYLGTSASPDTPATGKSGVATEDTLARAAVVSAVNTASSAIDAVVIESLPTGLGGADYTTTKVALLAIQSALDLIISSDSFSSSVKASN